MLIKFYIVVIFEVSYVETNTLRSIEKYSVFVDNYFKASNNLNVFLTDYVYLEGTFCLTNKKYFPILHSELVTTYETYMLNK